MARSGINLLLRERFVPETLATVAILIAMEAASRLGVWDPRTIPPISRILAELATLVQSRPFWAAMGETMYQWVLGLLISICCGVTIGIVVAASSFGFRSTQFVIDFLRTIPPVMLVPLGLLLFGPTLPMALILIIHGCTWLIVLQTIQGLRQLEPGVQDTARSFRLNWWCRTAYVVLPSAAPFIATGVRISATISLLLAVGAEVIGGAPGLGNAIALAQQGTRIDRLYALITVCALLGVVINVCCQMLERSLLSWHPSHREASI